MIVALMVACGGSFGAIIRYAVSQWFKQREATSFPIATFWVNSVGSFVLGMLFQSGIEGQGFYFFLAIGFCGALTTFSTFMWESLQLLLEKKSTIAFVNIIGQLLSGMIFGIIGYYC